MTLWYRILNVYCSVLLILFSLNCVQADAHINLASIKAGEGDIETAHTSLLRAVELAPDDGQALFNLAVVKEVRQEHQKALELYEKAKQYIPEIPDDMIRNCAAKALKYNSTS
eukprot:TRINITY_DN6415_c0_g1_i2.p2 TRINITY_DN6415_c0_g1~~TRINITY_DN6415_c0_g1_i2.p2  ORF type:complete len:113 (+),score=14.62 TRINITY_DN6415_c0_g1_i2:330-668(+)